MKKDWGDVYQKLVNDQLKKNSDSYMEEDSPTKKKKKKKKTKSPKVYTGWWGGMQDYDSTGGDFGGGDAGGGDGGGGGE